MKTIKERPFELKILIILMVVFGIINIISCRYVIINEKTLLGNLSKDILQYALFYFYAGLLIGFIQVIVAYGLYRGIKLAWYLTVIGSYVYLIEGLIFAVWVFPDIVSIVSNIVALYLLYRPSVRDYFAKKSNK